MCLLNQRKIHFVGLPVCTFILIHRLIIKFQQPLINDFCNDISMHCRTFINTEKVIGQSLLVMQPMTELFEMEQFIYYVIKNAFNFLMFFNCFSCIMPNIHPEFYSQIIIIIQNIQIFYLKKTLKRPKKPGLPL